MATTHGWKTLDRQVGRLRQQFLPNPFDPLGNYPNRDRVQAHTRAFLILCHAEMESYFEDGAKRLGKAAEDVWSSYRRVSLPLAFLLISIGEQIKPPPTLSGPKPIDAPQKLDAEMTKLFQRFYKSIKDNNGVKEQNLVSLFSPLGVPASAFTATLLANLDDFGSDRGVHAHNSAKQAVVSLLDPESEYKRVSLLVSDLKVFDQWLYTYRNKVK